MPNVGLVQFEDAESGQVRWFDTSKEKNRIAYKANGLKKHGAIREALRRSGVDHTRLATHESYIQPLMTLFKRRGSR